MEIYDTRLEAKNNAEYITPDKLVKFLSSKIKGTNLNILEPAVGSGQLLFDIFNDINYIDGYDVNHNSLSVAKNNFQEKINIYNEDFITAKINKKYDISICNYPFSLRPTLLQKEHILKDNFLSQFYKKDVTGLLDYIFILKSFMLCEEGYYLCFPGVGYRKQEEKFRKYLIDNNYIKEFGIIKNCNFEHTNIDILYLHLTKQKNINISSFLFDLKTEEKINKVATLEDFVFDIPCKEIYKEEVNSYDLEIKARNEIIKSLVGQIKFSQSVELLDDSINGLMPSVNEFIEDIVRVINSLKKTIKNN